MDGTGRLDVWVVVGLHEAEGFVGGAVVVVETIIIFVEVVVVVVVGVKGVNEKSSGGTGLGFEKKFLLENG